LEKKILIISCFACFIYTALSLISFLFSGFLVLSTSLLDIVFLSCFSISLLLLYSERQSPSTEAETVRAKNSRKDYYTEKDKIELPKNPSSITFDEVAGLNEVKDELVEIIDFLRSPEAYKKMGAKLPKGILFYGPPGTGKTLLARAVSGESLSSFHNACGAEFVEKYVGVGAKRVRGLFEKAKRESPSVIFIDEIDAIGSKRTSETNNEKDQTLNQLLVEIDGFESTESVIIIGATNRLDLLDEALLRPGRFDRQIYVGRPDVRAREEILAVHFKNKPLCPTITMKDIAKKTSGMTGAHLANIANESAILCVRHRKNIIGHQEIDEAIEKVLAGLERKSAVINKEEKRKIACHEAGHALVARYLNTDPVSKISIIPRGQALGYTLQTPDEDKFLITQKEMEDRIEVLFGGRAAEQLLFDEISSGAKDDLKKANSIAYEMVCELGMSNLGNIIYDERIISNCFNIVNDEVRAIIETCYNHSIQILQENKEVLIALSDALLEKETLYDKEIDEIILSVNPDFKLPQKAICENN